MLPNTKNTFNVISHGDLIKAKSFFEKNQISTLEMMARQFNKEQPFFTAAAFAWETMNMPDHAVDELLQSIFEVYYVVRILQSHNINTITEKEIQAGIMLFGEFNAFYKASGALKSNDNLIKKAFFKNEAVFELSINVMMRSFVDDDAIIRNKDGLMVYHSILRSIEVSM